MEFDPHTLQQIVQKIRQQVRCPQCGKQVPVDISSVRVAGDDFLLLQLRCETCEAYIVLHAALQGVDSLGVKQDPGQLLANFSTTVCAEESERKALEEAIAKADGSFAKLFSEWQDKRLKR